MDEQLKEMKMKQPIHAQLFIDFHRMYSYLQMACEEEKDEIRQEYDRDFLIGEGKKLYSKWEHFFLDEAAKEVMDSLKDSKSNE